MSRAIFRAQHGICRRAQGGLVEVAALAAGGRIDGQREAGVIGPMVRIIRQRDRRAGKAHRLPQIARHALIARRVQQLLRSPVLCRVVLREASRLLAGAAQVGFREEIERRDAGRQPVQHPRRGLPHGDRIGQVERLACPDLGFRETGVSGPVEGGADAIGVVQAGGGAGRETGVEDRPQIAARIVHAARQRIESLGHRGLLRQCRARDEETDYRGQKPSHRILLLKKARSFQVPIASVFPASSLSGLNAKIDP